MDCGTIILLSEKKVAFMFIKAVELRACIEFMRIKRFWKGISSPKMQIFANRC